MTKADRYAAISAATAAVALLIAACTGKDDEGSVPTLAPTPSVTVASTVATTVTTIAPPPSTIPIDAPAVLQQALAGLGGGYHFVYVATLNGAEVARAEGDSIAGASRLTLTSSGVTAAYIVTPEGSWAQPDGEEWESLENPPATTDPIAALSAPSSVSVAGADGDLVTLLINVPGVALGIPDVPEAQVTATVAGGVLQQVAYSGVFGGNTANVVTSFSPPVDTSPIVAPI
jgi:hypothetical protein